MTLKGINSDNLNEWFDAQIEQAEPEHQDDHPASWARVVLPE